MRAQSRGPLAGLALATVAALALAGCAEDGAASNAAGGEGVEFGASKEEYAEALADVDPIVIKAQSPSPKGSLTGAKFEGYMQSVEEWSDGKITFDIAYSNAIAPPTEVDDALADGRLDAGSVVLAYEPQEYPANALFAEATFNGSQGAFLGLMESNSWWMDVGYNTEEMFSELEDNGGHMIYPAYNSGLISLNCAKPLKSLADFKGAQIINGTAGQGETLTKLGATPVSMAYPEIFESLQRGVADCSMNSLLVSDLGGFTPETPYATIDSGAGFASGPGGWAYSKASWDSYPLVVQQLLFDRLDAFLTSNFESVWEVIAKVTTDMKDAGGGVTEYDDDAREAIAAINADKLESLRETTAVADGEAWVDYLQASVEKWNGVVASEYGEEVPYDDFAEFYSEKPDLQPLVDALFEEVLLEHRPS